MRVCQFRHDGNWTSLQRRPSQPPIMRSTFLFYRGVAVCQTANAPQVAAKNPRSSLDRTLRLGPGPTAEGGRLHMSKANYSNLASMVIFAFRTFDTGHPFSAPSAYFWKVAASAPGTLPTTSRWLAVIVQPESSFSMVNVTLVLILSGGSFAPSNCADSAMEKQAACAAAINSSGFVPGAFSNLVVNE